MRRSIRAVTLLAALLFPAYAAHADLRIPPDTRYIVRQGDINQDGRLDYLAVPAKKFVMIDLDDLSVPIPVYNGPTFALMSSASGYAVESNPAVFRPNDPAWSAAAPMEVRFGDITGTHVGSLLLRGTSSSTPSFTISIRADGTAFLVQALTTATLQLDLSTADLSPTFTDLNGDGRSDLVIYQDGVIRAAYVASATGTYTFDLETVILSVWRGFLTAMGSGNPAAVRNYFVPDARDDYAQVFSDMGASAMQSLASAFTDAGVTEGDEQYAIAVVVKGSGTGAVMYFLTFLNTDRGWKFANF